MGKYEVVNDVALKIALCVLEADFRRGQKADEVIVGAFRGAFPCVINDSVGTIPVFGREFHVNG